MEGIHGVYFGSNLCGKVNVLRQGLYYRFICRCQLTGEVVCRLRLHAEGELVDLGILVPIEDGFGLDRKLPVKIFPANPIRFVVSPRQESMGIRYIPIVPEEPFAYLERLKDAYLVKKDGRCYAAIPAEG